MTTHVSLGNRQFSSDDLPAATDRDPRPTETTVDTMVALTNPIFIRH
jgi:hypothetical protein